MLLLNPNELLAEEALFPATFTFGARGVAQGLDPGSPYEDVKKGDKLSTPLWLLPDLHGRGMVDIHLPDVYKERYRRKMNAGAGLINLRNTAPFFYDAGIKCNALLRDIQLSNYLSKTFRIRYQELIAKGLNTMSGEEVLDVIYKLTTEEQQLFDGGRESIKYTEQWIQRSQSNQQKSMVRKRPAAAGQAAKLQKQ